MNPCTQCKKKPDCPKVCYPLKDWQRGQKRRRDGKILESEGERYREQYYCMNHKCVECGFEKLKTDGCEAWEGEE